MTLAPWCANEKWVFWGADGVFKDNPEGCKFGRVTGRTRAPSNLLNNPLWWVRNDYEQQLSEAPWYEPQWPEWRRYLYWYFFRNPLQNGNLFKWGCADRNYDIEVIEGHMNPLALQRNDFIDPLTGLPEEGYQQVRLFNFDDGSKERAWSAYTQLPTPTQNGRQTNTGTQPNGLYSIKINTPKWSEQSEAYQLAWYRVHGNAAKS